MFELRGVERHLHENGELESFYLWSPASYSVDFDSRFPSILSVNFDGPTMEKCSTLTLRRALRIRKCIRLGMYHGDRRIVSIYLRTNQLRVQLVQTLPPKHEMFGCIINR